MSTVSLKKWGNSIGVRIPTTILKEAHLTLGEELEIRADKKGVLTLCSIKNQQKDWLEKFNAIADAGHDDELSIEISNDFDADEWTW